MSKLDIMYRRTFLNRMFNKGWGSPNLLERIIENHKLVSKRETCKDLIKSYDIKTRKISEESNCITVEGSFLSPFQYLLPDVMDNRNQIAKFQLLIPKVTHKRYKPLCIHFAGTGDENYTRRKRFLANPLLNDGVASLIHINPFYGERKPKGQKGCALNYLSDLLVMGGALILETHVLLKWAKKEGFDPLAVHGISMGGHMACLGVSVYPEPVCLIPCLSWTTASHVFTKGAMSASVSWDVLSKQYHNDEEFNKIIRPAINISTTTNYKKDTFVYDTVQNIKENNYENGKEKSPGTQNLNVINSRPTVIQQRRAVDKLLLRNDPIDIETIEFMYEILDFFTHLRNYSVPYDTRLATIVAAGKDAYIPMTGVSHFNDVWYPYCDIRVVKDFGHIHAYLSSSIWGENQFQKGVVDTLNRYVELYYNEVGPFGRNKLTT